MVWTVSSNGQIYKTMDGGKTLEQRQQHRETCRRAPIFNTIEAGDDVNTAYVAGRIGGQRGPAAAAPTNLDVDVPLIWRTTDGGKTWTSIVNGLPSDERTGSWVNSLRADPKQPGLLFAGTETTVYVSFDNGDHWQSLRQNLPSTSIRDLVVHTDHPHERLVIGTYGRGFWILDDITPLRQIAADAKAITSSSAYLFETGGSHPRPHQQQLGSALLCRSTPRGQSAVWRDRGLLPESPTEWADSAPGLRLAWQSRAHHIQHIAPADRGRSISALLAGLARVARSQHQCRYEPRQLEPATTMIRRPISTTWKTR